VVKGRIAAVQKNRPLLRRPLELWDRAFEAFGSLGETICYPGTPLCLKFEPAMDALLSWLYGGPLRLDEACAVSWEAATEPYDIGRASAVHQEMWERSSEADTVHALRALALLGAVELTGTEPGSTVRPSELALRSVSEYCPTSVSSLPMACSREICERISVLMSRNRRASAVIVSGSPTRPAGPSSSVGYDAPTPPRRRGRPAADEVLPWVVILTQHESAKHRHSSARRFQPLNNGCDGHCTAVGACSASSASITRSSCTTARCRSNSAASAGSHGVSGAAAGSRGSATPSRSAASSAAR
jgi:hypothetical protein